MSIVEQHQDHPLSGASLVWFLLVDSTTGKPYKGTSTDKISLHPSADVADVRKAVKAEHPNKLSSVDAADLLVYKNKAAFDKRNASVDEEKEFPLKSSHTLDGLGRSDDEENMLLVVVPSSIQTYRANFASCSPCEPVFYNSLCNAAELDLFLSFQANIPSIALNKLYIRKSYRTISSGIRSDTKKVIITGTPGIGKSLFLIYLLWKLVKEGKRVLFIYHPYNVYYDGEGGVLWFDSLPPPTDLRFWSDSLWCLFDAKSKSEADLSRFPYDECRFIVSTSPRREMMNDFQKFRAPQVFYIPVWSEFELEAIAPRFPDAKDWRERFEILGGIPRHVLENTKREPTRILEAACGQLSLDECIREISMDSMITDKSKVIHSLIHMTSAPPFTDPSMRYASRTALDIIVKEKRDEVRDKARALLESCTNNPLCASMRGYIFEPYVIQLLERGGTFHFRELLGGRTKRKPRDGTLNIHASTREVVDMVLPGQTPNKLYLPRSSNYAAIDAWIPGIGGFQITVAEKHGRKTRGRKDLAMLGPGSQKLYWLVPPSHYDSFAKQRPQTIEQYAVHIPYPEWAHLRQA